MPQLTLERDGETVFCGEISDACADRICGAMEPPYVPLEYPKWIEVKGEPVLVSTAEDERLAREGVAAPAEEPAPEPDPAEAPDEDPPHPLVSEAAEEPAA